MWDGILVKCVECNTLAGKVELEQLHIKNVSSFDNIRPIKSFLNRLF